MNVANEVYAVLWQVLPWRVVCVGPASGPVPNEGQRVAELRADAFGCSYVIEYKSDDAWHVQEEVGCADYLARAAARLGDGRLIELEGLSRKLPELPKDAILAAKPAQVLSRPVAAPPVPPALRRPDGSLWAVEDIDEALGPDPVVYTAYCDDYAGVCAVFGRKLDHRVIVNRKVTAFVLQKLAVKNGVRYWFPVNGARSASLSELIGRRKVYGMKKALAGFADEPAAALPQYTHFSAAVSASYAVGDWRRDSYRRVVGQVRDWRLVVNPDGVTYQLQTVQPFCWDGRTGSDAWVSVWKADTSEAFWTYFEGKGASVCPADVVRMVLLLPSSPTDCDVAELPRPIVTLNPSDL